MLYVSTKGGGEHDRAIARAYCDLMDNSITRLPVKIDVDGRTVEGFVYVHPMEHAKPLPAEEQRVLGDSILAQEESE